MHVRLRAESGMGGAASPPRQLGGLGRAVPPLGSGVEPDRVQFCSNQGAENWSGGGGYREVRGNSPRANLDAICFHFYRRLCLVMHQSTDWLGRTSLK